MLLIKQTKQFKKDYKKAQKQKQDLDLLNGVMKTLIDELPLSSHYLDHPLKGNYKGARECHVKNDWLLIYQINSIENLKEKSITFVRLGTHSELFE